MTHLRDHLQIPKDVTPFELAELAALLYPEECRGREALEVLLKAADLLVGASFVLAHLKKTITPGNLDLKTLERLARWNLPQEIGNAASDSEKIRLYRRHHNDDEVKSYLTENCSLTPLKTTKSVLALIEGYFVLSANKYNRAHAPEILKDEVSLERLAAEKKVPVDQLRSMRQAPRYQWYDARSEYRKFLREALEDAIDLADESSSKSDFPYYLISKGFLDRCIKVRIRAKKEGVNWKTLKADSKEQVFGKDWKKSENNHPKE